MIRWNNYFIQKNSLAYSNLTLGTLGGGGGGGGGGRGRWGAGEFWRIVRTSEKILATPLIQTKLAIEH